VVLSFALAPTRVAAEDYTKIGVKVGDTAEYSVTMTGVSTPMVIGFVIANVTGTSVTIDSAGSTFISGNVSAGGNSIWMYLIAANLTAGDLLYVGAPYTINQTITMTAAGESRTINHLNVTATGMGLTVILEIYWDKMTGLMTEQDDYNPISGWTNYTMITTSLFGVPAGIKNLAAISHTQNSITLNWTAPGNHDMADNATGYLVKYSTIGPINSTNWASATTYGQLWKPAKGGTTDTEAVSGLSANTTYYFAIEAYNLESLYGAVSNSPSATTSPDTTPPATITNLNAINPTVSSITLTWTAPGDDGMIGNATGYVVKYSTSGTINATTWAAATTFTQNWKPVKNGTAETHNITGLNYGTTYWFAIEAYDKIPNYSNVSNSPSATTLPDTTPPATITNLRVINRGPTSITLNWTAPGNDGMSGNAIGYKVRYSLTGPINSTNWASATIFNQNWIPAKNGTTEIRNVTGLSGDTTYWFAIEAYDKVPNYSNVSNSPSAKTLDNIPPATILDLSTSSLTNTSITLTWTAPGNDGMTGNATGYILKYSTTGAITGANWNSATTYTGSLSWTPVKNGTKETHVVSGLSPDTTYWFAIIAHDAVPNNSSVSNSPSGKTLDLIPPATITDLVAGNPTANSITLTWTAPGDNGMQGNATGYIVKYSTTGPINSSNWGSATTYNQSWIPLPGGSTETHVVTGLSSNTTYWFAIMAYDEVPNYSNVSTVSPSARTLAPAQPFGGFVIGASNLTAITFVAVMVALAVAGLAVYRRRWRHRWATIKPQDDLT
jgi:chitodextrinase